MEAAKLEVGDKVVCYDAETDTTDTKEVEAVHVYETDEPIMVYNIEVDVNHTYHVGEDGVLVHNMKCGVSGDGGSTTEASRTKWGAEHGKGNTKHNNAIETELDKAYADGATDIRKNRVQRDANGNRVYSLDGSYTRPDASYVLNGKRYNTNYISNYLLDNVDELERELAAFQRMVEADPEAINSLVFWY